MAHKNLSLISSTNEKRVLKPSVSIVMGSKSDWPVMQHAVEILKEFRIDYEVKVISAHRTPDLMFEFAEHAKARGVQCIIAGAGGSAHLPGMIAAKTTLPVLGVPVNSKYLHGVDSLLSIVQMPKGIPVATFAIGEVGATNAGLFATALLANNNNELDARLNQYRQKQTESVLTAELNNV